MKTKKPIKKKSVTKPKEETVARFKLAHELELDTIRGSLQREKVTILQNEIKCKSCLTQIWSASVHDYRTCMCGKVAVDGGQQYLKRCGEFDSYEDLSVCMDSKTVERACEEIYKHMFISPRNVLGIFCAVVRTLRDAKELKV